MPRSTEIRRKPEATATISPRWLARAFLGCVLVAALCGYLTFCGLFVQGQWQLVLHPVRPGFPLPALIGTAMPERVHFGVDASGRAQLAGLWLKGDPGGRYHRGTVLYLSSGDGSLAQAADRLAMLQQLGFDVCALDYRGYGMSAARHPSQSSLEEDSTTALKYVLQERHVAEEQLVLYGREVGGYLAARLAMQHPAIPAVVLEAPRFDLLDVVSRDPRVRLLPVRLLFRERFALEPLLTRLATPKLIFLGESEPATQYQTIAPPRMIITLAPKDEDHRREALGRFLDAYLPAGRFAPQAP